ncbi:MAG: right-handed parallel beta-helix repeat-containing protein [Chitinispirillaceae bacterium]|nr:right-handed parallel beta-helix repeat-containing protein [Chitinispirillaceae bacterium]
MKPVRCIMVLSSVYCLLVVFAAHATRFYVAPTGSDQAAGTESAPFASIGRAQTAASAGDTVFIRGGVYRFSGTSATTGVAFSKSGQQNRPIRYIACPGEIPIFDLFDLLPNARVTGFDITASWIHLRGLEVRGVQQIIVGDSWGIRIRGSNNILENLNVHHCEAPGIFITSGGNNVIVNCDSHDNYDPLEGGGNGDGFGGHVNATSNTGNVFRGCRAWNNSDDGYDCINCDAALLFEHCWSWSNGYVPGTMTAAGNGAGFKIGGFGNPPSGYPSPVPQHTVRFCVSFNNRAQGFYQNHHPVANYYYNNTSYNNRSANFNMLGYDLAAGADAGRGVLRNNIAFTGTAVTSAGGTDAANNTWNLTSISVTAADFLSIDSAGMAGPRAPGGTLPDVPFLRLATGSDLIDKGVNVNLPFSGRAPDLGAFESGGVAVARNNHAFAPVRRTEYSNPAAHVSRIFDLSGKKVNRNTAVIPAMPFVYGAGMKTGGVRPFVVIQIQ